MDSMSSGLGNTPLHWRDASSDKSEKQDKSARTSATPGLRAARETSVAACSLLAARWRRVCPPFRQSGLEYLWTWPIFSGACSSFTSW
jgi:hypothetical protein